MGSIISQRTYLRPVDPKQDRKIRIIHVKGKENPAVSPEHTFCKTKQAVARHHKVPSLDSDTSEDDMPTKDCDGMRKKRPNYRKESMLRLRVRHIHYHCT